MPILKFRCNDCGKEFAKILFTEAAIPKECPVCGAGNPEELGSVFGGESGLSQRRLCTSCDSCGDEGCRPAPAAGS
jgi:putative FmdB family regulatory protein